MSLSALQRETLQAAQSAAFQPIPGNSKLFANGAKEASRNTIRALVKRNFLAPNKAGTAKITAAGKKALAWIDAKAAAGIVEEVLGQIGVRPLHRLVSVKGGIVTASWANAHLDLQELQLSPLPEGEDAKAFRRRVKALIAEAHKKRARMWGGVAHATAN